MKWFFTFFLFFLLACKNSADVKQLQARIDSLEFKAANAYKPGFGEFMSSIQVHHNKLWFAGINQNWELANFEIHEIGEAIEAIKIYQRERIETRMVDMIQPSLDSLALSIKEKDSSSFSRNFILLTNNCNNCHQAVSFKFNKVRIPVTPPFSNQDFKPVAQ